MRLKERLLPFVDSFVVPVVWHIEPVRSLFSYVGKRVTRDGYHYLKNRFIANGDRSPWHRESRTALVRRFERIDRSIPTTSSPTDGLFLAEAFLSMTANGAVVECGCFAGYTSAKLSILCRMRERELHLFDTFSGLPEEQTYPGHDYSIRRTAEGKDWDPGRFAVDLEQVGANIKKYGELSACTFHDGKFCDTLITRNLPEEIAFAYVDVVLPAAARECLIAIWPRLTTGGVYFSHDVAFMKVLQATFNERVWRDELGQFPPIVFGAGTGLVDASPFLGFAVKGAEASLEYIKSLSIDKS